MFTDWLSHLTHSHKLDVAKLTDSMKCKSSLPCVQSTYTPPANDPSLTLYHVPYVAVALYTNLSTMHTHAQMHAPTHRVLMSRFSLLPDLTQKLYAKRPSNWLLPSHHRHRHYRHQVLNNCKKLTSSHLL